MGLSHQVGAHFARPDQRESQWATRIDEPGEHPVVVATTLAQTLTVAGNGQRRNDDHLTAECCQTGRTKRYE